MNLDKSTLRSEKKSSIFSAFSVLCLLLGLFLLSLNFYGLTQSIRKPGLGTDIDELRFVPESVWTYEQSMAAIDDLSKIDTVHQLAVSANHVVNQSLVHVDWERIDQVSYRQLIPAWENYFLYLLGRFSGLPQFERYHYSDYKRNIRRGIGICGDAATTLSSVLDYYSISNKIISFEGHVLVEYIDSDGKPYLMDPDFGVLLEMDTIELVANPESVRNIYSEAGYSTNEIDFLLGAYKRNYAIFNDTFHFMSKRYLFERLSYIAKWIFPTFLILFFLVYLFRFSQYRH